MPFRRVLVPALVAPLLASGPTLPDARQRWTETRTPHFILFSDLSEGETQAFARDFEIFRAMILFLLGPGDSSVSDPLELPVRIYLFRDEGQFSRYSHLEKRSGYFQQGFDGFNLAMVASSEKAIQIAYHEYFHYHLHRVAPDLQVPPWANEGLACLFQTAMIGKQDVRVGIPELGFLKTLHTRRRIPMRRLIAITHESPEYMGKDPDLVHAMYASSWFAVHYLNQGAPTRKGQLSQFLGRLRAGQTTEQAFLQAFDTTPEGLDRELDLYLKSLRIIVPTTTYSMQALPVPTATTHRPLTYPQVLGLLGTLKAAASRSADAQAQAHFEAALAKDPTCSAALIGQALSEIYAGHGNPASALPWLEKAVAADPSPLNHYLTGRALLNSSPGPDGAAKALEHLEQAASHGIGELQTLNDMAVWAGQTSKVNQDRLYALATAHPTWSHFRLNLAGALIQAHDFTRAKALITQEANDSDPTVVKIARNHLATIERLEAAVQEAADQKQMRATREANEVVARQLIKKALDAVGANAPAKALEYILEARKLEVDPPLPDQLLDLEGQIRRLLPKAKPRRKG